MMRQPKTVSEKNNIRSAGGMVASFLLIVVLGWGLLCAPFSSAGALERPEQKVTKTITDYILKKNPSWLREDIRLTYKFAEKTFDKLADYPARTTFRIAEVYPDFKPAGNAIFPVEVINGKDVQKIWLRVKVEQVRRIVAAARAIKRGKLLEAADFKLEGRDVAQLPEKYFVEYNTLIGKEARVGIPANSTLLEWMVGDLPLIRRGSEVTILVSAPGVTIKVKGEAMENGYANQEIKVKRKDSKKMITAKVVSQSAVAVKAE